MAPTIFMVPGLWEGSRSFEPLAAALQARGFRTFISSLKSTGSRAPNHPNMDDDINHLQLDLKQTVQEAGTEGVVVLAHSAGGFLVSNAMKGLTAPQRKDQDQDGGVVRIAFLAAGIAPEGAEQFGGPFAVEKDDGTVALRDMDDFFHDLTPEEALKWEARVQIQPSIAQWKTKVTYCGWRDVPSTYIVCELDRLLPTPVQENMAALAGSKVVRIQSGHLAQLSCTEEVASILSNGLA